MGPSSFGNVVEFSVGMFKSCPWGIGSGCSAGTDSGTVELVTAGPGLGISAGSDFSLVHPEQIVVVSTMALNPDAIPPRVSIFRNFPNETIFNVRIIA
ncbi:hypothetical protein [Rubinisphaera italica]|uniref:Uncharacterized protein n=1 Tax=Rubinisphaera italica TaxID=2527969 RepID=A0A5C5XNM4_9PLAN|nr:hypothetical protein [Rubinisphaera italica]TWT63685.1 hypothetical protein Pan54_44410 [Rubinisphaera italica]